MIEIKFVEHMHKGVLANLRNIFFHTKDLFLKKTLNYWNINWSHYKIEIGGGGDLERKGMSLGFDNGWTLRELESRPWVVMATLVEAAVPESGNVELEGVTAMEAYEGKLWDRESYDLNWERIDREKRWVESGGFWYPAQIRVVQVITS